MSTPSRLPAQRRKPGGTRISYSNRRQPLIRSESAALPNPASSQVRVQPTGPAERQEPIPLVKDRNRYQNQNQEPGLPILHQPTAVQPVPVPVKESPTENVHPELEQDERRPSLILEENQRLGHRLRHRFPTADGRSHQIFEEIPDPLVLNITDLSDDNEGEVDESSEGEGPVPLTLLQYLRRMRTNETTGLYEDSVRSHNVILPTKLYFEEKKLVYRSKFVITNISGLNITYMIKPTSVSKFIVSHEIGWIPPGQNATIFIETKKNFVTEYKDLAKEWIAVFAAPVFVEEQLKQETLGIYWKFLGSEFFPRDMAERHEIRDLLIRGHRCDECSILDIVTLNRGAKVTKFEYDFKPTDPEEVYTIWKLNGDPLVRNLILDLQYREFLRARQANSTLDEPASHLKVGLTIVGAAIVVFLFLTPMNEYFKAVYDIFYAAFEEKVLPPPPPPEWYDGLCFWKWNWGWGSDSSYWFF